MSTKDPTKPRNPPRPPRLRKRGQRAPASLLEDETPRGPRTKTIPEGKLPQVWTPCFLAEADGRFGLVKAVRDRIVQLESDTGANSLQKRMLCSRAAFLSVLLETIETRALESGNLPADIGSYVQQINSLVGLLRALGLELHAQDIGNLKSYIQEKSA